jgi:hypothetical protein
MRMLVSEGEFARCDVRGSVITVRPRYALLPAASLQDDIDWYRSMTPFS